MADFIPLDQQLLNVAKAFRAEADRVDTIFTQTCDSRALQGGAVCEEADDIMRFARKLFKLHRELMEGDVLALTGEAA